MRIAQLNDCAVCLAFRADKVRDQGLGEDFYRAVGSRADGPLDEQERLAVEYAERFAVDHTSIDDAFVEQLRASFTDQEIFDLSDDADTSLVTRSDGGLPVTCRSGSSR